MIIVSLRPLYQRVAGSRFEPSVAIGTFATCPSYDGCWVSSYIGRL